VGRKVDGRRKLEVFMKAEPGIGQRRKSQDGSKAGLEDWRKARAGCQSESTAGRSNRRRKLKGWLEGEAKDAAADESRVRFEGQGWRADQRRKLQVGRKAEPEDRRRARA
jgi:hypothetical protein